MAASIVTMRPVFVEVHPSIMNSGVDFFARNKYSRKLIYNFGNSKFTDVYNEGLDSGGRTVSGGLFGWTYAADTITDSNNVPYASASGLFSGGAGFNVTPQNVSSTIGH